MFRLFPSSQERPAPRASGDSQPRRTAMPHCDIHETATTVVVSADMPGVGQDGVEVRIHGDVLTLGGRSAVSEPERFTPLWREYLPRDYERTFRLGQDIDPDQVNASIRDGVLRVELKKRVSAQPRKIAVTAG